MGLLDSLRGQFVDVIERVDDEGTTLVTKYERPGDEIKQGSQVIVREGQCAVFMKGGALADIMGPGTFTLTTENLPLLSTLAAFKHAFNSPVKADLYFVNTRQFVDNAWGTRNPIMMRDPDLGMIRVRAFGRFAFRIEDVVQFSREVLAARKLFSTTDIVSYLASIIGESVATTLAKIRRVGAGFRDGLSRARSPGGRRGQQDVFVLRHPFHERRRRERLPSRRSGAAYRRAVRHCPRAQGHGFVPGIPERPRLARCGEARRRPCGIGRRRRPWGDHGGTPFLRKPSSCAKGGRARRHRPNRPGFARAKALVDEGILSQGEFEAKKKHLLGL